MNYQMFVFKYILDGDGSSSPNSDCFFLFFKSNSHVSINNENFTLADLLRRMWDEFGWCMHI